jgi:hypothetical protein
MDAQTMVGPYTKRIRDYFFFFERNKRLLLYSLTLVIWLIALGSIIGLALSAN